MNGCMLRQYIENGDDLIGREVTLSAVINDEIYYSSGIAGTSGLDRIIVGAGDIEVRFLFDDYPSIQKWCIDIFNNTSIPVIMNVQTIKLEVGNISTLANDPPQDYGEELIKSQRYLQSITATDARMAYRTSEVLQFGLFLATPMRAQPTIINGVDGDTLVIWDVNTNQRPTGFSYNFSYTPGSVGGYLSAWKTDHGVMDATFYTTNTRPVLFSAEL